MIDRFLFPVFLDPDPAGDPGGGGDPPADGPGDAESWYSGLPEELQSATVVKESPDLETFAKTAVHAQSLIGKDKFVIPGKDDAEGWGNLYNKLGRPEAADKYEMPEDVQLHEAVTIPEATLSGFTQRAHELGLSQRQAAGLYRWFAEDANASASAHADAAAKLQESSVNALKEEFGDAFDERVSLAKNAVRQFGGDELAAYMDQSGVGNHPAVVKAFANIGKALADDQLYQSGGSPGGGKMTPSEAYAEIRRVQNDPELGPAYLDSEHPMHKDVVQKVRDLYEMTMA